MCNQIIKDYIIITSPPLCLFPSKAQNGKGPKVWVMLLEWSRDSPAALVRFAGILGPLQLNLQPLSANLKPIHGLDGTLGRQRVVVAHEAETFAEIRVFVDENLGANDAAKRLEHLNEIHVLHVVGEVVDEQIAAFWACICGGYVIITSFKIYIIILPSRCFW